MTNLQPGNVMELSLYHWSKTPRPVPRSSPHFMNFMTQTTPTVRSVLGWPSPGDPYYIPQALGRLAQAYPE